MIILFLFGIVDFIVGLLIAFSGDIYLGEIGKFVGYALLAKGIWSMLVGLRA